MNTYPLLLLSFCGLIVGADKRELVSVTVTTTPPEVDKTGINVTEGDGVMIGVPGGNDEVELVSTGGAGVLLELVN